jgi:hypothetical protein
MKLLVLCADTAVPGVPGSWRMCQVYALEIYLSDSSIESARDSMDGFTEDDLNLKCIQCGLDEGISLPRMPYTETQKKEILKRLPDFEF